MKLNNEEIQKDFIELSENSGNNQFLGNSAQ